MGGCVGDIQGYASADSCAEVGRENSSFSRIVNSTLGVDLSQKSSIYKCKTSNHLHMSSKKVGFIVQQDGARRLYRQNAKNAYKKGQESEYKASRRNTQMGYTGGMALGSTLWCPLNKHISFHNEENMGQFQLTELLPSLKTHLRSSRILLAPVC